MFLTKTQSFVIEMATACLPFLPSEQPFTGSPVMYDFHEADRWEGHPLPRLMLRFRGVERGVEAAYTIDGSTDYDPANGTCILRFEGAGGGRSFYCWLQDNQMRVLANDTPLQAFGLNWDTVEKLRRARIDTLYDFSNKRVWELAVILGPQNSEPQPEAPDFVVVFGDPRAGALTHDEQSPALMAEVQEELLALCERMAACGCLLRGFDSMDELCQYVLECAQGVHA